jgi:uncharacterized protein (UPF0335 family)
MTHTNRRKKKSSAGSEEPNSMPENINDLKPIVTEFIDRYKRLENEEQELKLQKKELVEEYADKLDTKTLKLAMKEVELRAKVERKHYFDLFVHVLGGEVD